MARRPRCQILPDETCVVHVRSECSRSLRLLVPSAVASNGAAVAEPRDLRKELMMLRMETLVEHTAVSVCGFSLMDNHAHWILRRGKQQALGWSAAGVVRRWLALHPRRNRAREAVETPEAEVAAMVADAALVESLREKLGSVSQFMKAGAEGFRMRAA